MTKSSVSTHIPSLMMSVIKVHKEYTFFRTFWQKERFIIPFYFQSVPAYSEARGSVVLKAPRNKLEGREFETRRDELFLSIYLILPAILGPGVYSASNRNEYQKHKNNVSGE
jgi:hypothetical protein